MPGGLASEIRGVEPVSSGTGSSGTAKPAGAAAIARLTALPGVSTASGVADAAEHAQTTGQVLPVLPVLSGLLPSGGLRRGSTVAVHGSTSLLLGLLAEATAGGAWAAVVGVPDLGVAAADELGVAVCRLALVPRPGADFASVTAALLDGVDLVAVGPVGRPASGRAEQTARRLSARARHRGAVLLSFGPWPGAEVELRCTGGRWSGLDGGYGHLRQRQVAVRTVGRGAAARPARTDLLLPAPNGAVAGASAADGVTRVAASWVERGVG